MTAGGKVGYVIVIDTDRCKACELCIAFCPANVLALGEKLNRYGYRAVVVAKPELCTGCQSCVIMCPDVCIEIYKSDGAKGSLTAKGVSTNGQGNTAAR